jgi:hypothetical protein
MPMSRTPYSDTVRFIASIQVALRKIRNPHQHRSAMVAWEDNFYLTLPGDWRVHHSFEVVTYVLLVIGRSVVKLIQLARFPTMSSCREKIPQIDWLFRIAMTLIG